MILNLESPSGTQLVPRTVRGGLYCPTSGGEHSLWRTHYIPAHLTPPACRMLAVLPTLCVNSFWRGQPSCPAQNKLPDTYPSYVLWFAAKRENILKHKRAEVTGSTNVEFPSRCEVISGPTLSMEPLENSEGQGHSVSHPWALALL